MKSTRVVCGIALTLLCAATLPQCSTPPAATTPAASAVPIDPASLTPVLSVRELMTHIIDPTADWIFDAAVVDVSTAGTVATMPENDEEWTKVERGAYTLAEASNLLKMPRPVAPAEKMNEPVKPGKAAPELPPAQIQARIEADRARWNRHADELRTAALSSLQFVKTRDMDGLFQAGNEIDKACENCHLEYWYPGDRAAVLREQNSKATITPPTP